MGTLPTQGQSYQCWSLPCQREDLLLAWFSRAPQCDIEAGSGDGDFEHAALFIDIWEDAAGEPESFSPPQHWFDQVTSKSLMPMGMSLLVFQDIVDIVVPDVHTCMKQWTVVYMPLKNIEALFQVTERHQHLQPRRLDDREVVAAEEANLGGKFCRPHEAAAALAVHRVLKVKTVEGGDVPSRQESRNSCEGREAANEQGHTFMEDEVHETYIGAPPGYATRRTRRSRPYRKGRPSMSCKQDKGRRPPLLCGPLCGPRGVQEEGGNCEGAQRQG